MSEQEIRFMEYFEGTMLPNKRRITMDMLHECEKILGKNLQVGGCNACMHRVAVDMMNLYNRMKPSWDEYQKRIVEEVVKTPSEFATQFEVEIIDEVLPEPLPIGEPVEEVVIGEKKYPNFKGKNVWKKK